ncbi:MAG: DUF3883 domain-containing protein [Celeribacter sp.]|jgi:hypothetical protein
MPDGPWTDAENNLIVADYFTMLSADFTGQSYNRTAHNRALQAQIDRPRSSIEFKHQNISAVLRAQGEDWIPGYKPARNYQTTLEDAVARWFALYPGWLSRIPDRPAMGLREAAQLWIGPPPTLSNQPPAPELEQTIATARKFDVAERDEGNRALGPAGEERALAYEKAVLAGYGRSDLASKVRWVTEGDGDGAGYDIASYAPDGRPRLIEVKTTDGPGSWGIENSHRRFVQSFDWLSRSSSIHIGGIS